MEVKPKDIFTDRDEYGQISVLKQTTDGNIRRAFNPTQINELKEFAPELEDECKAMWTKEVIQRWENHQKKQEKLFALES